MVAHLLDDIGNSLMDIPQEKLDEALAEAADAIPDAAADIFSYWRKAQEIQQPLAAP